MHVTRGRFYWHFRNRQDALSALIADWEARNYFQIAQVQAQSARSDLDDDTMIIGLRFAEDSDMPSRGMAVRVWTRRAPEVELAVKREDRAWILLIEAGFARH